MNIFYHKNLYSAKMLGSSILWSLPPILAVCGHEDPLTKSYSSLVDLLEQAVSPKQNELVAQHKFFCRLQADGESTTDHVTALKALSAKCDFICPHEQCAKLIVDSYLRIQFIKGIRSSNIRESLLREKGLAFSKAVEIASAAEAAKVGGQIMELKSAGKSSTSGSEPEVHKLFSRASITKNKCQSRSSHRVNEQSYNRGRSRSRSRANSGFCSDSRFRNQGSSSRVN